MGIKVVAGGCLGEIVRRLSSRSMLEKAKDALRVSESKDVGCIGVVECCTPSACM